jgi:hypothetical protein
MLEGKLMSRYHASACIKHVSASCQNAKVLQLRVVEPRVRMWPWIKRTVVRKAFSLNLQNVPQHSRTLIFGGISISGSGLHSPPLRRSPHFPQGFWRVWIRISM